MNQTKVRLKSGQPNFRNINFLSVTWNAILSIAKGLNFTNFMKSVINCNFLVYRKSWNWCSQKTEQSQKDKLHFHLQWELLHIRTFDIALLLYIKFTYHHRMLRYIIYFLIAVLILAQWTYIFGIKSSVLLWLFRHENFCQVVHVCTLHLNLL